MKSKVKQPIDVVAAVSYNCNARCSMCDIWRITDHSKDLSAEDFLKLPSSLKFVNISGGETFLRQDIVQVFRNVRQACPEAYIIFSTNGFMSDLIAARVGEILKFDRWFGVAVSIDGVGATHDRIRGIRGVFKKCMNTIELLKDLGLKDIRIAYTFTQDNWYDFHKVQKLAQRLKVDFTCSVAQSSEVYFGGKQNRIILKKEYVWPEFRKVIQTHLLSFRPKQWLRAYYVWGLWQLFSSRRSPLPSQAATKHFFLAPDGTVYPSVVDNMPLGNIKEENFDQIWEGELSQNARRILSNQKTCWMICTARTAMLSYPLSVGAWILRNKFYAHLAHQ